MAVDLTGLRNAVSRNTTVDGSAAELLRGFVQRVKDAIVADDIEDAANINALVAEFDASTDSLAAAVAEHTPAAPPPPEG